MIAIPLDEKQTTLLSVSNDNIPYFALLDELSGEFNVIKNDFNDNIEHLLQYFQDHNVHSIVSYNMDDKYQNIIEKNDINVLIEKNQHLTLDEIYLQFFNKVYER